MPLQDLQSILSNATRTSSLKSRGELGIAAPTGQAPSAPKEQAIAKIQERGFLGNVGQAIAHPIESIKEIGQAYAQTPEERQAGRQRLAEASPEFLKKAAEKLKVGVDAVERVRQKIQALPPETGIGETLGIMFSELPEAAGALISGNFEVVKPFLEFAGMLAGESLAAKGISKIPALAKATEGAVFGQGFLKGAKALAAKSSTGAIRGVGTGTGFAAPEAVQLTAEGKPLEAVKEVAGEAALFGGIGAGLPATGATLVGAGKLTGATTKFGLSQLSGIAPETVSLIKSLPEKFSKEAMDKVSRGGLAERLYNAVQGRLSSLSETGKGYETIRQSGQTVDLTPNWFQKYLGSKGIDVVDGKLVASAKSAVREPADVKALQDVYSRYADKPILDANEFLNLRQDLSNISRFAEGKTGASEVFARESRDFVDTMGKTQIKGLSELDAKYAPEKKQMQAILKDYFNKDGTLKDGALNKLANLTGKGKDITLNRVEKIVPGISEEINILKAIEDVQTATGHKVGAYARGAGLGIVATGGNPVAAVLTAIISNPAVVVPIIRAYGTVAKLGNQIIDPLLKKLTLGTPLTKSESKVFNDAIQAIKSQKGFINPGAIAEDLGLKKVGKTEAGKVSGSTKLAKLSEGATFRDPWSEGGGDLIFQSIQTQPDGGKIYWFKKTSIGAYRDYSERELKEILKHPAQKGNVGWVNPNWDQKVQ